MSSAAMPAPVQALALWRSISVASAPRPGDQSRDVMRRGQGAALCLEWPLCFLGPHRVAIPWVESAVLRSQTRPAAGRGSQLVGVSRRRFIAISVA